MSVLRFCMMLSLVLWLGAIIYFGAVLAPTVFSVLPTRNLAGAVVTRSLSALHWIGICSGVLFSITSIAYSRLSVGAFDPFAPRHLLVYVMILITLVSQFGISSRMNALRTEMGVIDDIPVTDARRLEFNRLHVWSTRAEMAVLAIGLVVLYLSVRRFH
jgi:Domain of unknown function (DUF4149)